MLNTLCWINSTKEHNVLFEIYLDLKSSPFLRHAWLKEDC